MRIIFHAMIAAFLVCPGRVCAADRRDGSRRWDDRGQADQALTDDSNQAKRLLKEEAKKDPKLQSDGDQRRTAINDASGLFKDNGVPGTPGFKNSDFEAGLKGLKNEDAVRLANVVRDRLEANKQPAADRDLQDLYKISDGAGQMPTELKFGPGPRDGRGELPPGFEERLDKVTPWVHYYADRHPRDRTARYNRAMVDYYSGDFESAFNNAGEAIRLGKADPRILLAYGSAAYQLGDYHLAAQSGGLAAQMDPTNKAAQALYHLAEGQTSKINLPSALEKVGALPPGAGLGGQFDQASKSQAQPAGAPRAAGGKAAGVSAQASGGGQDLPPNVRRSAALTKEAAAALTVKDYDSAYKIAGQAIDLNTSNAQAWNYRAIADNKLARFSEAVGDASVALNLAPGNAAALQTRSWAFSKEGKYEDGLADANFTLEKEPDNSFAYQNRAFALVGLGNRPEALAALKRSAELDPRFRDKYEKAMQAPANSDLLFLFEEQPAPKLAPAPAPRPSRGGRFLKLVLLSLSGGLLLALAILNVASATWRDRIGGTIRRALGSAGGAPAAVAPKAGQAAAEPAASFWVLYEKIRTIGTGGMGVVYEARDRSLDRRVAVKQMREAIRVDPVERRRFVTEARTVAALHHPNIVDIYTIAEDNDDVYLVFEYIPGKTLAKYLKDDGPLDFEAARKIFRGMCEAVDYAHRQKVIHRDLKPSNIMITPEGVARVMDFGVARQAKDSVMKMSMTNAVVGTPPYMAPEQEQGTVRRESDIFSLGVCFYEMLCGRRPFAGQGAGMLLNKINGRHIPISKQPAKGVPEGLDEVFATVLAPDPEKRYSTPAELWAAVEAFDRDALG